jgi:hypothetical protein
VHSLHVFRSVPVHLQALSLLKICQHLIDRRPCGPRYDAALPLDQSQPGELRPLVSSVPGGSWDQLESNAEVVIYVHVVCAFIWSAVWHLFLHRYMNAHAMAPSSCLPDAAFHNGLWPRGECEKKSLQSHLQVKPPEREVAGTHDFEVFKNRFISGLAASRIPSLCSWRHVKRVTATKPPHTCGPYAMA